MKDEKKGMGQYLKQKKELLLLATLFWLFLGLIWFLCDFAWEIWFYILSFTATLLVLILVIGYGKWRQRLQELQEMAGLAAEGFIALPCPETIQEEWYVKTLRSLQEAYERQQAEAKHNLEDAKRYYALWSHQIKTPLSALRLLLSEQSFDRQTMEIELFKAEQYVEMALQYQRLAGKTGDLMLREYRLDKLVKQAVKRVAPLFIHKKLRVEIDEISTTVVTDEKWLLFVLEQLLTNAVKYTNRGTISICYRDRLLQIADTGIGILPEDLPRVFEWGYTGFNGRSEKRSTGIGLTLCKQMLKRLGHDIRLASMPGKGTTVFLYLDRAKFSIE